MLQRRLFGCTMAVLVIALSAGSASGASAVSATGPTVHGVSSCTEQEPFAIDGVVTGLEPGTSYAVLVLFSQGGSAGTRFTTDAAGMAFVGSIRATSPFEARVIVWLDPDGDFILDTGEPTVVDQIFVVDRPCEDARLKEPTSKDQCKNGGWRNFGVFKNQG